MTPHVHAKEIHAFAEGYEIEYFVFGSWVVNPCPLWQPNIPHRIKDPYRELKEAAADTNKEIRCNGSDWYDGTYWAFNLPPEDYEIRDKPAPKQKKKVRMNCYFTGTQLTWLHAAMEATVDKDWARVPFEDRIIEVEE